MERCKTCPRWTLAHTPQWERTHFCNLTETAGLDGEVPSGAALAISDDGAEAILFTAADFGCTEHPGNQ